MPSALPVLLADRQGVAFVATARRVEGLRAPRRYWGMEVGLVPIPAGDEEIRATELTQPRDTGAWPTVVPRPDLLAPALSRLISGEHVQMSLRPSRDGLRVTLLTPHGEEQPFPLAPKDVLGFLAAVFSHAPTGVVKTGLNRPARVVLSVRPASGHHEYRIRLAGVVASTQPSTLSDTGLSPSLLELILEGLERSASLFLVAGGPSSGRSTTLDLLASTLAARGHSGGWIGEQQPVHKPDLIWLAQALSDWPFPESLHGAAPDFLAVDRLEGPGDLVLAARLAASGTLVLACAPAAEPEALARTVARDIEAGSGPTVPLAILSQALVRTLCRQCLTWTTIPMAQAERIGFQRHDLEEMARKNGLNVPSGKGCRECAATGNGGLTGVFDYLAPEAGIGTLPRMREDGWRKVLQGIACFQDAVALPGAHRPMRSLREVLVRAGLAPAAIETAPNSPATGVEDGDTSRSVAVARRATAPASEEGGAFDALLLKADLEGGIDPEGLRGIARNLAARIKGDEPVQEILLRGDGFRLSRHAVNTALLSSRIAAGLGPEIGLQEVAELALLHDVGLIAAGIEADKDHPPVSREDSLDPEGARLKPESILGRFGAQCKDLAGLIRQVHELLSFEVPAPDEGRRPDLRVQAVALGSLIDLHLHGLEEDRPADLHEVTSLVMERHGRRFSPALFRALLRAIPIFPIGALVELSSGDLARVVSFNEDNHFRPRVEIAAVGGDPLSERRVVDLSRAPFLHIRQRLTGAAPDIVTTGEGRRR